MCGRAAISYSAADIADACRAAGLPLPPNTPAPAEYRVGSKSCEDKTKHNPAGKRGVEAWPCVVRDGGTLRLQTQKFGIQRLATHCIWCDGGCLMGGGCLKLSLLQLGSGLRIGCPT